MKFIFIDETSNNKKNPNFYGICGVCIDEKHYPGFAREVTKCFKDAGWNTEIEFKGSYLFSTSRGDPNVNVDARIDMVDKIIALNIAEKNAKLKAVFAWNEARDTADNHLFLVKQVLCKLLPSINKNRKEKPCLVLADRNDKILQRALWETVNDTLADRNYCLVEDVHIFNVWKPSHIGLCLCDLIGYMASWFCLSKTAEEAQKSLFAEESISQYDAGKAKTVKRIFQNLKNVTIKSVTFKQQL